MVEKPKRGRKKKEVAGKAKGKSRDKSVDRVKRTKERTIADIIDKVSTWRKLYNGIFVNGKEGEDAQSNQN